ncbi:Hypothetical_protein [Hexamita inflata]|uniref:Hypothetical_protein n=1 Tax=Hexamita inflata TaxID=28002 RepID=A0AA86N8M0_9EUKA|nr:Hypothetical protein HINF_LOCUS2602 [Hexamita inflata]
MLLDLKLSSFEINLILTELALLFRIHRQIKVNSIKLLKEQNLTTLWKDVLRFKRFVSCSQDVQAMLPNLKFVLVLRYWIYECHFVCNFVLIQIVRSSIIIKLSSRNRLSQDQELTGLHVLKPQSYKQVQGDAFELSPESIAQFYFVDTKIGIAMIIQYTKKYKLDTQDVEWAKLAAPKVNNAKNMNDIIQIVNE